MAQNSRIEWCHHTINLWWGCTKINSGCDNCYAETISKRWGKNIWGNDSPRLEITSVWKDLDRFQRLAHQAGEMHRVFVGSMMDIFEKPMPLINSKGTLDNNCNTGNLRFHLFYRIDRGDYPNLLFLFLTKRPSNINKYIFNSWNESPPKNVMFGSSCSTQKILELVLRQLSEVKGNKFLSIEPQLEEISLRREYWKNYGERIIPKLAIPDWIIQGGESGPHKRPFNIEWARILRDECKLMNIPYFFKQIDKVRPIPNDLLIREFPKLC
jgi:protein gp37